MLKFIGKSIAHDNFPFVRTNVRTFVRSFNFFCQQTSCHTTNWILYEDNHQLSMHINFDTVHTLNTHFSLGLELIHSTKMIKSQPQTIYQQNKKKITFSFFFLSRNNAHVSKSIVFVCVFFCVWWMLTE